MKRARLLGAGWALTPDGYTCVSIYRFWSGDVRVRGVFWYELHRVVFDAWALPLLLDVMEHAP